MITVDRACQDDGSSGRQWIADESGFTLIELLVTMVLAVIVIGAGVWGLAQAFKQTTGTTDRTVETSNAELGLQVLARDLKNAAPCPTGLIVSGSTLAGNSTDSAGIVVSSGATLQMCDPQAGLPAASTTSQLPSQALVTWTYSSTAETWTRTIANISGTTVATTPTATQTVYGVASAPTLTGLKTPVAGGSAAVGTLANGVYLLNSSSTTSTTTGTLLSWIGIKASLADLAHPGLNTVAVANTAAIPVNTGVELRNFGT